MITLATKKKELSEKRNKFIVLKEQAQINKNKVFIE